ncbi:DNRLRE domain-containing protein [Nocardioides marmoriginsengisoli]|uniref:DNRLRE domain-containing protein n=1 Tax=Nocardioides marmoriginsengisoli TaxID=661483 RepID=A0A3N0CL41_9ACTN|nr:DNRLRE domain-containing protein [Nocardioides marmoriginsengisoli]RNL64174.1 DNRLRE domain-containing protein [Nocardioides marmoriginsengisoli]
MGRAERRIPRFAAKISLSLALGLTGIAVPVTMSASADPAQATPVASDGSAESAAAAAEEAVASGQRVEDLDQRSEVEQVFANPDGSWTSETATEPVRTRDDEGEWTDIDLTLEAVPGGFAPVSAIGGLTISDGGDRTFAEMSIDGRDLGWRWPESLPVPTIDGNIATYANVIDGGDLVVTATRTGFRHDIVLREAPVDPVSFQIPVVTGGPTVREEADNALVVATGTGDELVTAPQPIMYDAVDQTTGHPENQAAVNTTVTKTSTGSVITLDPAESFLNDPGTTYPVTIDPTWSAVNPNDTWVWDTNPTAIHPYDETLYAGTPDGGVTRYRTYLEFENGLWQNQVVSAATLTMRNFDSATCSGTAVRARRVTSAWTPGTTTWNNQPAVTGANEAASSAARGFSTSCPAADVSWNVKDIVGIWAANPSINYGFQIAAASETGTGSFRKYRSAGYTYTSLIPRLSVTYNSYPYTPTNVAISPGLDGVVGSTTPTLSATVSDRDLGSVRARFNIYNGDSGTDLVWSGDGTVVASGGRSQIIVPSDVLVDGSHYTVKVYGFDGALLSGTNVPIPIDIDTSASVPEIDLDATDPAPPMMTTYGVDEYQLNDLEAIAANDGTTLQQAVDRYGWGEEFGEAVGVISAAEPGTFAYAEIADVGAPSATVHFKGSVPSSAASAVANLPVPVALVADAPYSDVEQADVVSTVVDSLNAQLPDADSFVVHMDPATGVVSAAVEVGNVGSRSPSTMRTTARAAVAQQVPSVSVPDVSISMFDEPVMELNILRGGVRIGNDDGVCTTGFPANEDVGSNSGLLTARHCPNDMYWYGVTPSNRGGRPALSDASRFLSENYGDIQYSRTNGEAVGKAFYDRVGHPRRIEGVQKPYINKKVCMFGRKTNGYRKKDGKRTCTTIKNLNQGGHIDDDAGGPGWDFKRLVETHGQWSSPGDSGGPWFSGGNAVGIVTGNMACGFAWQSRCDTFTPIWGNEGRGSFDVHVRY